MKNNEKTSTLANEFHTDVDDSFFLNIFETTGTNRSS
jgi:hypothetical protein